VVWACVDSLLYLAEKSHELSIIKGAVQLLTKEVVNEWGSSDLDNTVKSALKELEFLLFEFC
jgi:hypothetical protein